MSVWHLTGGPAVLGMATTPVLGETRDSFNIAMHTHYSMLFIRCGYFRRFNRETA